MHILIIPSWYSINSNPTMGSFFKEQAKALNRYGNKVTVAYPGFVSLKDFGKNKIGKYLIVDDGIPTYRDDTYNLLYDKIPYNLKPYLIRKKLLRMYRQIEREQGKPDVIHAHSCFWAAPAAVSLGKKIGVSVVITEHSTIFSNNNISKFEGEVINNALMKATKVIAVSKSLKSQMQRYCNRKDIEIIHNIVDTELFNIRTEYKKKCKFTFLTVCYLTKKKGIDVLIKAFSIKFKGRNVLLKIGGAGIEEENLKKLSISLGIEKQVLFLGALSREDVVEHMNSCDVFVLPSRHETFGVVFIEALACGKPIIATKTGGPNEIINKDNGVLVQIDNIDELAEAMNKIMNNYSKYNRENIRKDCVNRFSEEVISKKINDVYLSLKNEYL